jgi:hypothetical protein
MHSRKLRIAACSAAAGPFRGPSAAIDARISSSEIAKRSARVLKVAVFAAAALMNAIRTQPHESRKKFAEPSHLPLH